ncbi:MAG: sigma-54-dependent Fis family transcriptional regulator [Myxococcales bacterium]|nr:sigma-54-dependent Fis family transcriptional regulator [Myxococcales bacterium]MCB9627060.1 sigma-54-dependent Fis family transcriptional regulator [Sandaracinaceae bacterium]
MARVLIVDDEPGVREMLGVLLRRSGYACESAAGAQAACRRIQEDPPYDAVVTDLTMPDGSGMDVLSAARVRDPHTQVLMITAYATTEQAVVAMRKGAYDYIQKPFRNAELLATLEKALEKRALVDENQALRAEREGDALGIVGRSDAIQRVRDLVERVADAPSSVLITGESGTGKEVVARALHYSGARNAAPFVVVNCGALPEALMESELFGHEKGAFTGASARKKGLFQEAEGGTLFLDEVGELPLALQVKLLRVLQERRVRPVGGANEVPVEVRIVAASNRDLEEEVRRGGFREDLYYRLNVIRIELPPLRERADDIPTLARHLLRKHNLLQRRDLQLSGDALRWLSAQSFPGNVRQLENVIERAVTLTDGPEILPRDFVPQRALAPADAPLGVLPEQGLDLEQHLAQIELGLLQQALERTGGNRTQAAALLGMSFRQFRYRLAKHDPAGTSSGADEDNSEAD